MPYISNKNEPQMEMPGTSNEDSRIETDYLVSKLNSLMEKNRTLLNEAKKMKHDRDSNIERVHTLEKDLKELDMKRYRRYKEKSI